MSSPLVEVVRNGVVDAVHQGVVAVVDADGRMLASVGDPAARITYWRSAAKPFQALPVVYSGAAERWALDEEDLALIAASHNGELVHVRRAASILERIGYDVGDLECGIHPPLDPQAADELRRAGEAPTPLHNNCSANHLGMLALAGHLGAPAQGYRSPGHPAQREILGAIARFTGLDDSEIAIGVDGCGVPCFGTSVHHLALAFARLREPRGLSDSDAAAARAIVDAMTRHPYLVGGRRRIDTDLMQLGAGAIVAKGGASGVLGIGVAGGLGLAIKIDDGAGIGSVMPTGIVGIEALRQLEVLGDDQVEALRSYARPKEVTLTGETVGEARPVFELERATRAAA